MHYCEGKTTREIAEILKTNKKSVVNAITRENTRRKKAESGEQPKTRRGRPRKKPMATVDESHAAFPAKLYPLAWKWMNIYADEWGCYWTLASGSLSRFWQISEISQKTKNIYIPEIVDNCLREKLFVYEKNRIVYRNTLHHKGMMNCAIGLAFSRGRN